MQLSEEQQIMSDMAAAFTRDHLRPNAQTWDETAMLDREILKSLSELGFGGIYTSERYGGSGLSRFEAVLIFEQLAKGCISHATFLSIHNMATWMVDRFASDALRSEFIPRLATADLIVSYCLTEPGSGSDAASLKTSAVRDGDDYVLNGSKVFISGAGLSYH